MALGPVKRLRKELQSLEKAPDPDISLAPQEDNIRLWTVSCMCVIERSLDPFIREVDVVEG